MININIDKLAHNRKVDVEELTSFQDWLRQMVDGEAITEVEDCYACQASQGVKTAKIVNGDVAITVVLKLSKLKKIVRNSTFVRIKQMLTNMHCSLFFRNWAPCSTV